jgi:hypothetical protein
MSTSQNVEIYSGEAGSAVTAFRMVVVAADGQYDHVGTAQTEMDGVAAETVATVGGELPIVALKGGSIVKVEAGAAVTILDEVASDNVGRGITAVSGAGNWVLGKALDAASAAGEIIRVQVAKMRDQV